MTGDGARGGVAAAFIDAVGARDRDALAGLLAEDVTLHSPMLTQPFTGRPAAVRLYDALFATLEEVTITDRFALDAGGGFRWLGVVRGAPVEGVDLVRMDDAGRVREVRVFIRPLPDIGRFAAAVGPPLSRRRGPRGRAGLTRAAVAPLVPLLRLIDRIAVWLTPTR